MKIAGFEDFKVAHIKKEDFDIKSTDQKEYYESKYEPHSSKQRVPQFTKVYKGLKLLATPNTHNKRRTTYMIVFSKKTIKK